MNYRVGVPRSFGVPLKYILLLCSTKNYTALWNEFRRLMEPFSVNEFPEDSRQLVLENRAMLILYRLRKQGYLFGYPGFDWWVEVKKAPRLIVPPGKFVLHVWVRGNDGKMQRRSWSVS